MPTKTTTKSSNSYGRSGCKDATWEKGKKI